MAIGYQVESLTRSSGTVSVTTTEHHPFIVGDKVRIYNALGGGTVSFMAGNPYTVTGVTLRGSASQYSTTFRYAQAGPDASTLGSVAITAGSAFGGSNQYVQITTASEHGFLTQPKLKITGVTVTSTNSGGSPIFLQNLLNGEWDGRDVQVASTTSLILRLPRQVQTSGATINWTTGVLRAWQLGVVVALDDGINVAGGMIGGVGITTNTTKLYRTKPESFIVGGILNLAYQSKGLDYPFLRLFDPSDKTKIAQSQVKTLLNVNSAAANLRSILDTVVESYSAQDLKPRRYFINQDGQLVYQIVSDAKPPTANAPYAIVTSGTQSPNASTTAATVTPYSLSLGYDHDTTKRALFRTATQSGAPIVDLIKFDSPDALGTSYTRLGAPYFDDAVDYPTGVDAQIANRQAAAKSFFSERYAPVLSGSFTLRGAGTASWNNLGFTAGYAQVSVPTTGTAAIYTAFHSGGGTVSASTYPYPNYFVAGMAISVSNLINPSGTGSYSGTSFTIGVGGAGTSTAFTYAAGAGLAGTAKQNEDAIVVAQALYVRTGTAPNQIVTVTFPNPHGLTSGALTTITGLTGAAGTSMNITGGTITVTSPYVFTYPSTGTNGTATGPGTVSSITYVPRWEPGQWVSINAPEVGLNDLYRVEQVDWALEPGSFQQLVTITFNRRPAKLLTRMLQSTES